MSHVAGKDLQVKRGALPFGFEASLLDARIHGSYLKYRLPLSAGAARALTWTIDDASRDKQYEASVEQFLQILLEDEEVTELTIHQFEHLRLTA